MSTEWGGEVVSGFMVCFYFWGRLTLNHSLSDTFDLPTPRTALNRLWPKRFGNRVEPEINLLTEVSRSQRPAWLGQKDLIIVEHLVQQSSAALRISTRAFAVDRIAIHLKGRLLTITLYPAVLSGFVETDWTRAAFEWTPERWREYVAQGTLLRDRVQNQTEAIVRIAESAKPQRILDAGCGYGRVSLELARRLPESEIVAIDQSATMVEELARSKNQSHIRVVRGNIECLPLDTGSVDLVICVGALMHVRNEHAAMSEFIRVLGRRGSIVLTFCNCLNPFSIIFIATTLVRKATGYRQSFHFRPFYERLLTNGGYHVRALSTPIIPGVRWPGPLKAFVGLDLCATRLGYEPILEGRSGPSSDLAKTDSPLP